MLTTDFIFSFRLCYHLDYALVKAQLVRKTLLLLPSFFKILLKHDFLCFKVLLSVIAPVESEWKNVMGVHLKPVIFNLRQQLT